MAVNYITDKIAAVIGAETDRVAAFHPIESSEVRRFVQATLDPAPRHWKEDDTNLRFGGAVAPLAFPTHAFRPAPSDPDPLEEMGKPDFDGISREFRGLPPVEVPLPRLLNGGFEYEFFRYARVGDRIYRKSRYRDIFQKESKGGPMVMILVEDEYSLENGDLLLRSVNTIILR
jgi:N-terminal half of MaoC dehydratase